MNTRRIILVLHLWAAALATPFLFLLGVTGSLIAFEDEIDRALNGKFTWIQPGSQRLSLTEMKARLEKSHPGYTVSGFQVSPRDDIAWGAFLDSNTSQQGIGVSFNQFTGDVLGNSAERIDFVNDLHQFHLRLLAGKTGATVVSVAAVFLLFLSMSGLVLWWPRKVLTVKWQGPLKKLNFDLHQALGIYSSFFLMIFSLTAIVIHWENEATSLANLTLALRRSTTLPSTSARTARRGAP